MFLKIYTLRRFTEPKQLVKNTSNDLQLENMFPQKLIQVKGLRRIYTFKTM